MPRLKNPPNPRPPDLSSGFAAGLLSAGRLLAELGRSPGRECDDESPGLRYGLFSPVEREGGALLVELGRSPGRECDDESFGLRYGLFSPVEREGGALPDVNEGRSLPGEPGRLLDDEYVPVERLGGGLLAPLAPSWRGPDELLNGLPPDPPPLPLLNGLPGVRAAPLPPLP